MTDKTETRTIDLSITTEADPAHVWKTLTDVKEIANWFPPKAEGDAGEGGKILFSWGEGMEWWVDVVEWEPGKRVRWADHLDRDAKEAGKEPMLIDLTIETKDGQTTLRLVHSGFGMEESWDNQYYGTLSGWLNMLQGLRHYLAVHFGTARKIVSARRTIKGTRAEAWNKFFGGADALVAQSPDAIQVGQGVTLNLGPDMVFDGICRLNHIVDGLSNNFSATIPALEDAFIMIELEPGQKDTSCGVWLSTYGVEPALNDALQAQLVRRVESAAG